MPAETAPIIAEIRARGAILRSDVERLRRGPYERGARNEAAAEALLALNTACPVQDTAWAGFLAETIGDFAVRILPPSGYLTSANVEWLRRHLAPSGRVASHGTLEALIRAMETARWAPGAIAALALDQVRLAVATGVGLTRSARHVAAGSISDDEVALARRILIAYGAPACRPVCNAELEVLLRIDADLGRDASSQWLALLRQALASHALAASGYATPPRQDWLASQSIADLARLSLRIGPSERALHALEDEKIRLVTAEAPLEPPVSSLTRQASAGAAASPRPLSILAEIGRIVPDLEPELAALADRAA